MGKQNIQKAKKLSKNALNTCLYYEKIGGLEK